MSDEAKSDALEAARAISAEYQAKRKAQLKSMHASGKFVTGSKEKGKSIAQLKKEKKEAWKNRHSDPNYKGLSGYTTHADPKTTQYIKAKDYNHDYDKMGKGDWHEPTDKRRKADPYRSEPY